MAYQNTLPKKSEDLSAWYNQIVLSAELADYGPAKGTMIFRPYGYRIWELVQEAMDKRIKDHGVDNAYFPLFIPESFLKREKEHVEGFAPELAVVTVGGGEELEEKLVVRPTSETIMYDAYSRWIQSWRDLPILINQWNNVVRWEKRTYLFLRTTEFLWQEGHTAHATHEDAVDTQKWAMQMYADIYKEYFALPGIVGYKSQSEKFAGADATLTYESLMPEGKALQACTSHDLGQNFAKAFNISFQDKEGKSEYAWQTSWGFSTRSLGGLFMAHGDDKGLVLPPKLAPIKVVILPVLGKDDKKVLDFCEEIKKSIKAVDSQFLGKVEVLDQDWKSIGWKASDAEMRGIPIIIPVGLKEAEGGDIKIQTRIEGYFKDENTYGNLVPVTSENIGAEVERVLSLIQGRLLENAQKFLKENTHIVNSYDELKKYMETTKGFLKAFWCEDATCESKIKEETKATTRCLPLDAPEESGKCVYCGKDATHRWIFAQAY